MSTLLSANEIRLVGEAPLPAAVNDFSKNLKSNNDLAAFEWQVPEPKSSSRGWQFTYTGAIPTATP